MYLEFSFPIDPQKPVADKKIQPAQVVPRTRMDKGDKSNTSYLSMYAHTGTHIDSPWHFNNQGWRINDFEINQFVFDQVLVLRIPKEPWQPVERRDLEPQMEKIRQTNALLINTGFAGIYRGSDAELYLTATPGLALDAAQMLATLPNLKCIGVDSTSIENLQNNRPLGYPVHHALLDRAEAIILLEDANLDVLENQSIRRIFLFPLRVADLEASPITAVAEIG
jgi:arylformamidase